MKVTINGKDFEMCWPIKAIFEATGVSDLKDLKDMSTTFEQIQKCAQVGLKYAIKRDLNRDANSEEIEELNKALDFVELNEVTTILSMGLKADVGNLTAPTTGA